MKRSEMIAMLKRKLRDLYSLDFSTEERAKFLLEAIEEAGMLPPFNTHDFYSDGDKADERRTAYRTWEEE